MLIWRAQPRVAPEHRVRRPTQKGSWATVDCRAHEPLPYRASGYLITLQHRRAGPRCQQDWCPPSLYPAPCTLRPAAGSSCPSAASLGEGRPVTHPDLALQGAEEYSALEL
jgi:hypothetical protein